MPKLSAITKTDAPAATLIIRLMVGAVFVSEGIQKFLNPADVGAGRFAKIGLPSPDVLAPFVGCVEIVCGSLVLFGILTRLATLPLLIVMATAIITTKVPILQQSGFWKMAHEGRTDFSMTMGLIFLLMVGAGTISWDARRSARASGG
ncbi:MAG: DoxX family protein [Verrucomicrobia bacterium]|nr:DoxX family protein [Verrucomicrobiota bacterium]